MPAAPVTSSAPSGSTPATRPKKAASRCASRRVLRIRLKRGWKIRGKVTVRVDGRRVRAVRKGNRITTRVDLRGLRRTRVTVRITARTTSGRRVTDTRRYRTCTPRTTKPAKAKAKAKTKTTATTKSKGKAKAKATTTKG
jgi:predicted thioesterase